MGVFCWVTKMKMKKCLTLFGVGLAVQLLAAGTLSAGDLETAAGVPLVMPEQPVPVSAPSLAPQQPAIPRPPTRRAPESNWLERARQWWIPNAYADEFERPLRREQCWAS